MIFHKLGLNILISTNTIPNPIIQEVKQIQLVRSADDFLNCQAQGPTLGPTQGRVEVKVRTWSGHGQVTVRSGLTPTPTQKWDLSYTLKLVFTTTTTTHPLNSFCSKLWVKVMKSNVKCN